jgi:four helix bundle protein
MYKIKVYELSMKLCELYLPLINSIPDFTLRDQMSRSLMSVPSNIAEGYGRRTPKDYSRFLRISIGSLNELESQLSIAHFQGYFTDESYSNFKNELTSVRVKLILLNKKIIGSGR